MRLITGIFITMRLRIHLSANPKLYSAADFFLVFVFIHLSYTLDGTFQIINLQYHH